MTNLKNDLEFKINTMKADVDMMNRVYTLEKFE